jgi:hypothetical protein
MDSNGLIAIGKQDVFTFCKMFENVPVFKNMHSKLAKCANIIPKNYFQQNSTYGIKKRRILC